MNDRGPSRLPIVTGFGLGLLAGLMLAPGKGALRRWVERNAVGRSGLPSPTRERVWHWYRYYAAPYDRLVNLVLFGQDQRLREETVARLSLKAGDTVLDLACGTGKNFPLLMEQIGPTGRLIGFDYTPEMLAQAERKVGQHGWDNVTLIQGDAAELALDEPVDAVICTLAMSVIPGYQEAIRRAVAALRPGGVLAVGDIRLSDRQWARLLNPLADLIAFGTVADIGHRPWEQMAALLNEFHYHDFFMGFFYVASGRMVPRQEGGK